jgi:hypothetical protein
MKFSIQLNRCLKVAGWALVLLAAALVVPRTASAQPTMDGAFYCTNDIVNYNLHATAATGKLYTTVVGGFAYAAMVTDPFINDNVFGPKKWEGDNPAFNFVAYQDSAGWICKDGTGAACTGPPDEEVNEEHNFKKLHDSDKNVWRVVCGTKDFEWEQDLIQDTDDDNRLWSWKGGEADHFSNQFGSDGSGGTAGVDWPANLTSMSSLAWNMNQTTWDMGLALGFDSTKGGNDGKTYISPVGFAGGANGYSTCDTRYNWEWRLVYEIKFPLTDCDGAPISLWVADAHNSPEKNDPDSTTVCTEDCDLPVELVSFTATEVNGDIQLLWSTSSETNNAGFAIEHAINRGFWNEIDFVGGAGTSRVLREYSYRVLNVEPGKHTFRLKQVDLDGAFEYSSSVEIAVEVPNAYLLEAAYPNPFNPQTTIRFGVKNRAEVTMAMYDATGRVVRTLYKGVPEPNEMHEVRIDGSGLPSGVYLIRLTGESFLASQTVTLVK